MAKSTKKAVNGLVEYISDIENFIGLKESGSNWTHFGLGFLRQMSGRNGVLFVHCNLLLFSVGLEVHCRLIHYQIIMADWSNSLTIYQIKS